MEDTPSLLVLSLTLVSLLIISGFFSGSETGMMAANKIKLKNLSKKKKKGRYRKNLAQRAFMYLIDDGAKRYVRSYGGNHLDVFPKRQRKQLAKDYVEEFEEIFKNQEYDFMR